MNSINWFEIPAKDIQRAAKFYGAVLEESLELNEFAGTKMAMLGQGGHTSVHGAVVQGEGYEPSDRGSIVYLNGGDDLATPLARVAKAGGKVILEKTPIGPHGFIGMFIDTEGNRVAFHSSK